MMIHIMQYPVAIWNTNSVYTAKVPDLPSAVTEANSVAALEMAVKEAAIGWMGVELNEGPPISGPNLTYRSNPDDKDCLCDRTTLSNKTDHKWPTLPRYSYHRHPEAPPYCLTAAEMKKARN